MGIYRRSESRRRARAAASEVRQRRKSNSPAGAPKVLLTGDLGKLGGFIADATSAQFEIVGYDISSEFGEDIRDLPRLRQAMRGCDYVVHAAAIPHPRRAPMKDYVEVNVVGTLNILRAAIENRLRRMIYLSSTAYYGCDIRGRLEPMYFPIDEGHPIASVDGRSEGALEQYNQSKVMAEQLVAYYGTNRELETVVLRIAPANLKSDTYPQDFDWRGCTDYRRGSFFATAHPESVGEAVLLALQADGPLWYEAFNIVDRYTHETIDMHEFLAEEYPEVEVRREIGSQDAVWDTSKAQRLLGFVPREDRM